MKVLAVIPARYGSVRFPGKPLKLLAGKPMIQHVYEAVVDANIFTYVSVATDDERIASVVKDFGGHVTMTSPQHLSGTDRVAEVAQHFDCDVVVNVQGDEPFMKAEPLRDLVAAFADETVQTGSLMHLFDNVEDVNNPAQVKVVCDLDDYALYFSRSPIPYPRDIKMIEVPYWKHIGVYAFRKPVLMKFVELEQTFLEKTEMLEQLRLLQNGYRMKMIRTSYNGMGIDTPEDMAAAEIIFQQQQRS